MNKGDDYCMLQVLGKEEIIEVLREKYGQDCIIELYIDYNDEGVEGNNPIIAEINTPEDTEDELIEGNTIDFLLESDNN